MRRRALACAVVGACALSAGCDQLLGVRDPVAKPDDAGTSPQGDGTSAMMCPKPLQWSGPTSHQLNATATGLAVGALEVGGRPEALLAVGSDILVYTDLETGSIQPLRGSASPASNVALADVNGDGKLDVIAWTTTSTTITIYLQMSLGQFGSGSPLTVINDVTDVIPAHFSNSTTGSDLLVLAGGTAAPYINVAADSFLAVTAAVPMDYAAAQDADGDGYDDILLDTGSALKIAWNTGTGNGDFAAPTSFGHGNGVVVGKFGDATRPDLVVFGYATNPTLGELFTQPSARGFSPTGVLAAINETDNAFGQAIDLDNDGLLDLVLTGGYALQCPGGLPLPAGVSFYPSESTQWSSMYALPGFTATPPLAVLYDVNGDGKPDIVALTSANNELSVITQL